MKKNCPCGSGESYEKCCKRFHGGQRPDNALLLMRSRYAAYVLDLPHYIIKTTHPASPQYHADHKTWAQKISEFSKYSRFERLEILDFKERGTVATVTFVAYLFQEGQDVTFTEKSYFEKVGGKWLYRSGQLASGHAPNLITTEQMRLLPLAYYGNPILRESAKSVQHITDDLKRFVEEMVETMDACDGIGLAAPQVHHAMRLFVIRVPHEGQEGRLECGEVKVFINPTLSLPSKETWSASEGCLSIPTIHAHVKRPKEITVEYTNLEGQKMKERLSGWEARVVMHENDHINGVLFIDHLDKEEREKIAPFLKDLKQRIHDGTEL